MTKQQQSQNSSTKPNQSWLGRNKALLIVAALTIAVGALISYGVAYYFDNRAQEVARPLEKALADAGAVKQCENGDSGRGWDNNAPWYRASYEFSSPKDQAISLIEDVASKNGYSLTHASPTNRGPLGGVADEYIDQWYFDESSKQNPYRDIEDGPVRLSLSVYEEGEKNSCTQQTIQPGRSVIGIGVDLPEFRR